MNCQIQRLKTADWRRGRDIRLQALANSPDAFGSTLEKEQLFLEQDWIARITRENTVNFLAFSDEGEGIGMLSMAPYDEQAGLFGMWVTPAYRGLGVGGKLVDEGIKWAKEKGFTQIYLDVGDLNTAAIALYSSRGFCETGQTGTLAPPREHIQEHQRLLLISSSHDSESPDLRKSPLIEG